ncbi:MAG: cobalamin-dependent protein [Spirochaetales bacterium]|nr:cobalamin-dependent protein [Spirochaetales bacterium]
MNTVLDELVICIERGKINKSSPFPKDLEGQNGADELTKLALDNGINPKDILSRALIHGMNNIGIKFKANKVFVPEVLMAAKAMHAALFHLKPFFNSGDIKTKGTFVIGTVVGDLHDIGKNIVAMMIEGGGWEVIDLGINVSADTFIQTIDKYPHAVLGMSALLTTTMMNMETAVAECKKKHPETKILIGGAPITSDFAVRIGADFYAPDPQGALEYLNTLVKENET